MRYTIPLSTHTPFLWSVATTFLPHSPYVPLSSRKLPPHVFPLTYSLFKSGNSHLNNAWASPTPFLHQSPTFKGCGLHTPSKSPLNPHALPLTSRLSLHAHAFLFRIHAFSFGKWEESHVE
jgi:hypothetical protein